MGKEKHKKAPAPTGLASLLDDTDEEEAKRIAWELAHPKPKGEKKEGAPAVHVEWDTIAAQLREDREKSENKRIEDEAARNTQLALITNAPPEKTEKPFHSDESSEEEEEQIDKKTSEPPWMERFRERHLRAFKMGIAKAIKKMKEDEKLTPQEEDYVRQFITHKKLLANYNEAVKEGRWHAPVLIDERNQPTDEEVEAMKKLYKPYRDQATMLRKMTERVTTYHEPINNSWKPRMWRESRKSMIAKPVRHTGRERPDKFINKRSETLDYPPRTAAQLVEHAREIIAEMRKKRKAQEKEEHIERATLQKGHTPTRIVAPDTTKTPTITEGENEKTSESEATAAEEGSEEIEEKGESQPEAAVQPPPPPQHKGTPNILAEAWRELVEGDTSNEEGEGKGEREEQNEDAEGARLRELIASVEAKLKEVRAAKERGNRIEAPSPEPVEMEQEVEPEPPPEQEPEPEPEEVPEPVAELAPPPPAKRKNYKHDTTLTGNGRWANIARERAQYFTTLLRQLRPHDPNLALYDGHEITPEEWNAGGFSMATSYFIRPDRASRYVTFARQERKRKEREGGVSRLQDELDEKHVDDFIDLTTKEDEPPPPKSFWGEFANRGAEKTPKRTKITAHTGKTFQGRHGRPAPPTK